MYITFPEIVFNSATGPKTQWYKCFDDSKLSIFDDTRVRNVSEIFERKKIKTEGIDLTRFFEFCHPLQRELTEKNVFQKVTR